MLIQWWRWRGWRWGFFLPRIRTVENRIYKMLLINIVNGSSCSDFTEVSCLGLHCVQWSKMEASKQIHPWLKLNTCCNWTASAVQTQSRMGFVKYDQGREQSPRRLGKVNVKLTFSILGHSVSSVCLPLTFTRCRGKESQSANASSRIAFWLCYL